MLKTQVKMGFFRVREAVIALLALAMIVPGTSVSAEKIGIGLAKWNSQSEKLIVRGRYPATLSGLPVTLIDSSGRVLTSDTASADGRFEFARAMEHPESLCSVRLRVGDQMAEKRVQGVGSRCTKAPQCQILAPASELNVKANVDVNFSAKALLRDKKAGPLKLEWDFGGGSMGQDVPNGDLQTIWKRPDSAQATVRFVRDNSRYRVRFTAMDGKNRYCEDSIEIAVGAPPDQPPGVSLMSSASEKSTLAHGSGLRGNSGSWVVLPYEEWTMQSDHDMRIIPNAYVSMSPTTHNLRSVVYEKGALPRLLGPEEAGLKYSASVNAFDPAGSGSINSTSQNWPLNVDIRLPSLLSLASIKKTDFWEKYDRPQDQKSTSYYISSFWMAFGSTYPFSGLPEPMNPEPDEGYIIGRGQADELEGSYMPGKNNPYVENSPKNFAEYNASAGEFLAKLLPYTDIDDAGRVNPYPLLRVEANKQDKVVASTDGVINTSRDFHCRGCHAKGKIAANPNTPFTPKAYASSASGKWTIRNNYEYAADPTAKPNFFDSASNSLWDQEYAAMQNYSSLHAFYNNDMLLNVVTKGVQRDANGKVEVDAPVRCIGCHSSGMASEASNFNEGWWAQDNFNTESAAYDPLYSVAMHRFHGELQWNDAKTDILRDADGRFIRWDWKTKGRNTRTLFPSVDANGKALPMEQNCLQCHAGHREPQFRDRMYTAGQTCFDCHGDMLAVGEAFPKNYPSNKAKLGSTDLNDYRITWFDEPDCASCHTGNANTGRDGKNGFFSAGVMKRAFDDEDLSATPRAVDRNNPDTARFSAAPLQNFQTSIPISLTDWDAATDQFTYKDGLLNVDTPLYRSGRDAHGNVPCAACHGSSHGIWPIRNPNANDNVTALQLQGHTGPIAECSVCHSSDAFTQSASLDGGRFSGLPENSGILGGPHNMHPINDPNWWKITSSNIPGGWHTRVSTVPGRQGEDQCAACHGEDHKGTRLSKAAVDRVFVLNSGKKVKINAGEPVSCGACHSLQKSFAGTPHGGGGSGGGPVTNHAPVISSAPKKGLNAGEAYSYNVIATDADGDKLTYSLQSAPIDMTINAATGEITWTASASGGSASFIVVVSDGKSSVTQQVSLVICVPPTHWDAMGMCH